MFKKIILILVVVVDVIMFFFGADLFSAANSRQNIIGFILLTVLLIINFIVFKPIINEYHEKNR